jgi:hypothetical protein
MTLRDLAIENRQGVERPRLYMYLRDFMRQAQQLTKPSIYLSICLLTLFISCRVNIVSVPVLYFLTI